MAPRETENNAYAKFGVTNKEHYGMFWYFLERSIGEIKQTRARLLVLANFLTCLPPEIPRGIAFLPSILKRLQRWRVT